MEWNLPPYYRPVYPFGIANQQPQLPADDHHDGEVDQLEQQLEGCLQLR